MAFPWRHVLRRDAKEPVRALRRLPDGPVLFLRDPLDNPPPYSYFIGKGNHCDIRLNRDDDVSETHCMLMYSDGVVEIRDHRHDGMTLVNNVIVVDGHAILRPGNVLTLYTEGVVGGNKPVNLVACGRNLDQKPEITAPDMPKLLELAKEYHGSGKKVAEAFGFTNPRTVQRWYRKGLYNVFPGAAVLMLALGGWYWTSPSSSTDDSVEPALSMPASSSENSDTTSPAVSMGIERPSADSRSSRAEQLPTMPATSTTAAVSSRRSDRKAPKTQPSTRARKYRRHIAKPPDSSSAPHNTNIESPDISKEHPSSFSVPWTFPGATWDADTVKPYQGETRR